MLVGCRSRRNVRIKDSPNCVGTNIVNKGFLHSSPIASITAGGKNPSLGIRHYKLRTSPQLIREGLGSQKGVQGREKRYYVLEGRGNILIKTKLQEHPVC